MPLIWGALSAVLGNLVKGKIGFWAASLLGSFGLWFVAQEFAVEPAMQAVQNAISAGGAEAVAWFAYMRIDDGITALLSAYAVAAGLSAVRLRRKPA